MKAKLFLFLILNVLLSCQHPETSNQKSDVTPKEATHQIINMIPKEYGFKIKFGLIQDYNVIMYNTRLNALLYSSFGLGDSLISETHFKIDKEEADSIFDFAYKSNQNFDILIDNGPSYINDSFFEISASANNRRFTNYYSSDSISKNNVELKKIKSILNRVIEKNGKRNK